MNSFRSLFILALTWTIGCASSMNNGQTSSQALPTSNKKESAPLTTNYITDVRQVTFAGLRAGEGYFSQDGRFLIFQSEREPSNPFYQIYLMDLQKAPNSQAIRRLSPGQGKTTCAWIAPNNKHILFSSTHHDANLKQKVAAEWEERKNPKQTKYAWSFDEQFDIYTGDINGRNLKNVTKTLGYDAEASFSPDGKWIAFASNRRAYNEKLNSEEQEWLKKDPSYFMDIYIMRSDGSEVKRLTSSLGYDGGPFFSPDGKRLTFRRFSPDGGTAEVMTIGVDGRDEKQITRMKAMSWAPFYHPSGDYLIFASNKFGYANFELFIVDTEGKNEPVRVSDLAGFDGLPVFSPDGLNIFWTHSNDKGDAQIYRGRWNDAQARSSLQLSTPAPKLSQLEKSIQGQDAMAWIEYLASPQLGGRMTGSAEERQYMTTLADRLASFGLSPVEKTMLTPYEFTSGVELASGNSLSFSHRSLEDLKTEVDYVPLSYAKNGDFEAAGLVFAGYGIQAPAQGKEKAYDSYAGLDVKDKWVVAFTGLPEEVANTTRFHLHLYSRLQHKALVARMRGARGLILVDDSSQPENKLAVGFEGRSEDSGLPVLRLSGPRADQLFALAQTDRNTWTKKLAQGDLQNFAWVDLTAKAQVNLNFKKAQALNVFAQIKVPGAKETVIIGAHGDHLGHGERGNSLATKDRNQAHLGADDNASGVAGVMEIAQSLAYKVKTKQWKPQQNIVFAVWSGEEIGLLGSAAFLKAHPQMKISAYLNMDMIGRYRDQLIVQGVASAKEWPSWIEASGLSTPLNMRLQNDPYVPSDAMGFYLKNIPVLSFFTGSHSEYHTPKDTPQLINTQGLAEVSRLVESLAIKVASHNKSTLTYQKVESTQRGGGENRGFRLYLGTIPDYTQEGQGVLISGTGPGSPAEKAGLRAGDRIVELGGIKIQNLYDYVYCLQALKANEPIKMTIVRSGQPQDLKIVPVLKSQQ